MLNTTHAVDEMMSALTEVKNRYPGSSAHLVLYTSGDGALIFERGLMGMLDPDNNRIAVDFDAGHEADAITTFRQKIAARFGN